MPKKASLSTVNNFDKPHFVYRITDTESGKKYIGACRNPKRRWFDHVSNARAGNVDRVLYTAMREKDKNSFTFEILRECLNKKEAWDWEVRFILSENSLIPNGFNTTCRGVNLPQEHAANIRRALRQESVRAIISEKLKIISRTPEMRLKRATMTGKNHTAESRQKMSESAKGKKQSESHVAALTAVRRAKGKLTEENIKTIRGLLKEKIPQKYIASLFGVCQQTVSNIAIRKLARDVA